MDRVLYKAAVSGSTSFLLTREPDLDKVTPQENTALHVAVSFKHVEFSEQLLHLSPLLLLKANKKGESSLHVAAKVGCFEIAALLVNTATTFYLDVEGRMVNVTKELLKMVNHEKEMALHVAVKNGHLEVAKLLMEAYPESLEFVNRANASPLYLAVDHKFSRIASCIIEFSPASNCAGPRSMTALHSAVIRAQLEIVKVLSEKWPEMVEEVDMLGWTPLHYAAAHNALEATKLILRCNFSAAYILDKDGLSAFHIAATFGHIKVMEELIQSCPDIAELTDNKGHNALHVAIIRGQIRTVNYILKSPELVSIINEHDEEGNSAMHLAVIHRRNSIITLLANDRRIEKNAMNKQLFTASDIFHSQKHKPCFTVSKTEYLLEGTGGLPYFLVDDNWKESLTREAMEREKSISDVTNENTDETTRSMLEIHLLVAMLIATVTYAAAFQVPGGYEDDGPDEGIAIFIEKTAFRAFVIFNAIGFYFSVATVYIQVANSKGGYHVRSRFKHLASEFIFFALHGMVLAFASGCYLMLSKNKTLAMTLYLMAGCCLLSHVSLWFFDPAGTYFPGLTKLRIFFRRLLFRYGII